MKGVIMGQRRGDPWTKTMEWFTPSTPGWAEFTRVNPALEWKFCNVWRFLRGSGLPYCVLYDQGYTSLGERGDTAKNEALRLPNGEYRPAYELAEEEEHLERHPRSPSSGAGSGARQRPDDNGGGETGGEGKEGEGAEEGEGAGEREEEGAGEGDRNSGVVPRAANRISARDKRDCGLGMDAGGEVVEIESRACLQPEGKGRVVSTGWVGGSARWLPVTLALALVLAAVGGRRSDSPRGG
ncbi:unnamed protein product, partial [Laminaria digitata]